MSYVPDAAFISTRSGQGSLRPFLVLVPQTVKRRTRERFFFCFISLTPGPQKIENDIFYFSSNISSLSAQSPGFDRTRIGHVKPRQYTGVKPGARSFHVIIFFFSPFFIAKFLYKHVPGPAGLAPTPAVPPPLLPLSLLDSFPATLGAGLSAVDTLRRLRRPRFFNLPPPTSSSSGFLAMSHFPDAEAMQALFRAQIRVGGGLRCPADRVETAIAEHLRRLVAVRRGADLGR